MATEARVVLVEAEAELELELEAVAEMELELEAVAEMGWVWSMVNSKKHWLAIMNLQN